MICQIIIQFEKKWRNFVRISRCPLFSNRMLDSTLTFDRVSSDTSQAFAATDYIGVQAAKMLLEAFGHMINPLLFAANRFSNF